MMSGKLAVVSSTNMFQKERLRLEKLEVPCTVPAKIRIPTKAQKSTKERITMTMVKVAFITFQYFRQ